MAERDVIVRLGVKPIQGGDAGLKAIGQAADKTTKSEKDLVSVNNRLLNQLKEEKAKVDAVNKDRRIQNTIIEKEIALKKQANQLDRVRAQPGLKSSGTLGVTSSGSGLLGLAGLGSAAGIITGFTAAMKGAEQAVREWSRALIARDPVVFGESNQLTARGAAANYLLQSGGFSAFLAQGLSARNPLVPGFFGRRLSAMGLDIGGEMEAQQNRRGTLAGIQASNQQLETLLGIRSQTRQEQGRLGLQLQQSLLSGRRFGTPEEQLSYRQSSIDLELQAADRDRLRAQQEIAEAQQRQAKFSQEAAKSGMNIFREAQLRLQAEGELVKEAQALKDLQDAQNRGLEAARRQSELLLEVGQRRLENLRSQKDAAEGVVRTERERIEDAREQFGFLNPLEKAKAKNIAERLAGGFQIGDFSREELSFAKGLGVFRDVLSKRARAAAGPEFEEIAGLTGFRRRLGDAERAAINLEQKIQVQIQLNEKALADQIQQQVTPKIQEAMQRITMQSKNDFARALEALKASGRAGAAAALGL